MRMQCLCDDRFFRRDMKLVTTTPRENEKGGNVMTKSNKGAVAFGIPSEVFQPEPTPRNASVSFQRSRIMLPPKEHSNIKERKRN